MIVTKSNRCTLQNSFNFHIRQPQLDPGIKNTSSEVKRVVFYCQEISDCLALKRMATINACFALFVRRSVMPFIVCPECHARNRIPVDKDGLQGKCGRCAQPLPAFSLKRPIELQDAGFPTFIEQFSDLLILVDFYSSACGPCKMITPIIAALPQKFEGRLAVGKLNTDSNQQTAYKYRIRGVPTLLFFRNGQIADQVIGALPEHDLHKRVTALLR